MSAPSNSLAAVKIHSPLLGELSSERKNNTQTDAVPPVSVQEVALESLAQQTAALAIHNEHPEDNEIILKALGGVNQTDVQRFEKEYGHTMQAIMDAISKELAEVRKIGAQNGFGGFKIAGIKKWKVLIELNEMGNIKELYVGHFQALGGFTKVYYTFDGQVIMVPKKDSKKSVDQMLAANDILENLYDRYAQLGSFTEEFSKIFKKLGFPVDDFQETIKELKEVLPPLPFVVPINADRVVMIAPKATPVQKLFHFAPQTSQDIIKRLEVLRDVALCLTLAHGLGLIHGDIKPGNMLLSNKNKGHLADFGGSLFLTPETNRDDAALLMESMIITPSYVHYKDFCAKKELLNDKTTSTESFSILGRAMDIYALGVSVVVALNGRYDSQNARQTPFMTYQKVEDHFYVNAEADAYKQVTCIGNISAQADKVLQLLLESALDSDYNERLDASEFVQMIQMMINLLKRP